jgi:acetyl CoA:N6-hydroxylysine acetyl transferase
MNLHLCSHDKHAVIVTSLLANRHDLSSPKPSCSKLEENHLRLYLDGETVATVHFIAAPQPILQLTYEHDRAKQHKTALTLVALEAVFAAYPDLHNLRLSADFACVDVRDGAFIATSSQDGAPCYSVYRSGFYQTPHLWIGHAPAGRLQAGPVPGPDGRDHPLRPPHPEGLCYERFDPIAKMTVSLRAVDCDRDLDRFHRWMNDPRVAYYWELAKPRDALRSYLENLLAMPHSYPLIVCIDGEEAGYLEVYWAREDRLGKYYDAAAYDRGWHGLIGERRHLGRVKTCAWMRSIMHYLFLDCPLTEHIVVEPRVDNQKVLAYTDALAYEKIKEFDFPHKRSVLVRCRRDDFFSEVQL